VATLTRLTTAEELERLSTHNRCELIDGVLIEMPPVNAEHGGIAIRLGGRIDAFAFARSLGHVSTEVGFILRRSPDTVRAPDVAFVRADRIPSGGVPRTFWAIAPDLAVEVASPSNTASEIQSKVHEWITAGVRLVWVINPLTRTVSVIRSLLEREELTESDALDGGEVLPGFTCPVAELFA